MEEDADVIALTSEDDGDITDDVQSESDSDESKSILFPTYFASKKYLHTEVYTDK